MEKDYQTKILKQLSLNLKKMVTYIKMVIFINLTGKVVYAVLQQEKLRKKD